MFISRPHAGFWVAYFAVFLLLYFHILFLNAVILRAYLRLCHLYSDCFDLFGCTFLFVLVCKNLPSVPQISCIGGLKLWSTVKPSALYSESLIGNFNARCIATLLSCQMNWDVAFRVILYILLRLNHTHYNVKGMFQFLMFAFLEIFLKQRKTTLESRLQKFHQPSQQKAIDLMPLSNHNLYIT